MVSALWVIAAAVAASVAGAAALARLLLAAVQSIGAACWEGARGAGAIHGYHYRRDFYESVLPPAD